MLCHLLALPEVQQLRLVPTYQNPFKSGDSKSAMTPELKKQAVECWVQSLSRRAVPGLEKLKIEWLEFESEQVSYTVETLAKLQSLEQGKKHWVVCTGDDCLTDLHKWKAVDQLLAIVEEFWVFPRKYPKGEMAAPVASLELVNPSLRPKCVWRLMAKDVIAVSSTELRGLLNSVDAQGRVPSAGYSDRNLSDLLIPELVQLLFPAK